MAQRVVGDLYYDLDGQLSEIKRQLRQPNGYPFDPLDLKHHLQNAVEGRMDSSAQNLFTLPVNYSLPVSEALKLGSYDWVNPDITDQHFPIHTNCCEHQCHSSTRDVTLYLVHFDKTMSNDAITKELDRQGLRDATIHELLALGSHHPDLQRKFPIVARGSVYVNSNGRRRVLCLDSLKHERDVYLHWLDFGLPSDCRFAAVSK